MNIQCKSVAGGWQTLMMFADGNQSLVGPVFNRANDLWDWQRANLFNVVDGYVLASV